MAGGWKYFKSMDVWTINYKLRTPPTDPPHHFPSPQVAEAISNIGPAISQTVIPQVVDDDHPDAVHNDHDHDHHHAHAGVDPLNLSSAANHTRRRRRQATRRSLDTKLMSPPRVVPSRRSNHSSDAAAAAAAAATTGGRTDASVLPSR